MTGLDQVAETLTRVQSALLGALPWVVGLVGAVIVVYFGGQEFYLRRRYRGNTPARLIHLRRQDFEEEFGLTVRKILPSGVVKIAPGETANWVRAGLSDEVENWLGVPLKLKVFPGKVRFSERVLLPDKAVGTASFNFGSGEVVVGLDGEDAQPVGFSIRENSALVVGAMPGGGKTVLLNHLVRCMAASSQVIEFDGKVDDPDIFVGHLQDVQAEMAARLASGLDFWNMPVGDRPDLLLVVIDEAQAIFQPRTRDKAGKEVAAEREAVVRDLVSRGRSAGVLVVLASQRLTVDAIPSAIRDLAGVKLAGRVTRPEDAELVLGLRPGPDEPTPVGAGQGRFVVNDGRGGLREVLVYAPAD